MFLKKGFTLAELLITIAIIGVVSAITIPILNNHTNKSEYRTALKKSISAINQALELSYALEGTSANDYSSADLVIENIFKKRLNILDKKSEKDNKFTNEDVCSSNNGSNIFKTTDGIAYCLTNWKNSPDDDNQTACDSKSMTPCSEDITKPNMWIDVNGDKKPNRSTDNGQKVGDIFPIMVYDKRAIPLDIPTIKMLYESKDFKINENGGDDNPPNNNDNGGNNSEPENNVPPEEEEPEEECDPNAHCVKNPVFGPQFQVCNTTCPYKKQCKSDPNPNPLLGLLPSGMTCL
ncbi:MAG: type II secretion system protein [Candidatus Gastranaerophilales bacterium]|nr:type II secretion system protein [Candidatus Gastranaerophilales bacterium]